MNRQDDNGREFLIRFEIIIIFFAGLLFRVVNMGPLYHQFLSFFLSFGVNTCGKGRFMNNYSTLILITFLSLSAKNPI